MNRRHFLSMLSAGAFGAMTLDVDKLLWTPGARTIFLPPKRVVAASPGLSIGDIVMIEGRLAINPVTRQAIPGVLQYFVVTSAHESDLTLLPYHLASADEVTLVDGGFYPQRKAKRSGMGRAL